MLKFILILVMILGANFSAQAEIYKWKDESGKIHYGDKPVKNSEEIKIKQEVSANKNISKAAREERRRRLIESYDEERKEKKELQAKQQQQKSRKDAQCGQAIDRLRRYKKASGLYEVDKDGNRIALSKKAHKKSISKLKKQIKRHCK